MKLKKYYFVLCIAFLTYSHSFCQNQQHLDIGFLKGNWFFIDTVYKNDSAIIKYHEVFFNDSLMIEAIADIGAGPFYSSYQIDGNNILTRNSRMNVTIDNPNKIEIEFKFVSEEETKKVILTRMEKHDKPLKEFYSIDTLNIYDLELRKRAREYKAKRLF